MGHKRYGYLPKSKAWRKIISEMSEFASGDVNVEEIAVNTLKQVRARYEHLQYDPSVKSAFESLLSIAFAFRQDDPMNYLRLNKYLDKNDLSVVDLARMVWKNNTSNLKSKEYETVAKQAAMDALHLWYTKNVERGRSLFHEGVDAKLVFSKSGKAEGFCELSRLFFSKFTERYLNTFLDREVGNAIPQFSKRTQFKEALQKHVDDVSKYAFDSAKITESFSAGWFNKHVTDRMPNEGEIKGYISFAFGKMQSELLQEALND